MNTSDKRPSFAAMASTKKDNCLYHSSECYLRDLKRDYAKRLDNINYIKSTNDLSAKVSALSDSLSTRGGNL